MSYLVMALNGRLGNNLWQFASGLAISQALDARLCFDAHRVPEPVRLLPELVPSYVDATPRELRRVGVGSFEPGTKASLERFLLRTVNDYGRRVLRKSSARTVLYEGGEHFREDLFALDLPAYVAGYFQDERFLDRVADQVVEAIRWPAGTPALPDDLGATVAVSFRRADYNLFDAGLPLGFYERAMRILADTVPDPTFVLFGDDPAFVELFGERARRLGFTVASALPLGRDPITQLRLQSECDHAIVANSTFAWWGAWLGDRRAETGRVVIAPAGMGRFVRDGWTPLEEQPGVTTTYDLSTVRRGAAMS